MNKCVCQICNCGRHRCPHKPEYRPPTCKFGGTTTVQDDFVPKTAAVRKSFKPDNAGLQSTAPLESITSYRHDFVPHPVEPCRQRTRETYKPSDQPMETLTTTRQHFQGLAGERRKSFKPANSGVQSTAPLESITSYRHVFVPHPVEPRWQRLREAYKPSNQPMESLTTTRQHFQGLAGERRKNFKPSNAGLQSTAPLESVTSYRHEFVPHPVEPCKQRLRETYKPSDQPMENLTTTRQHFQGLAGERRKSFKPSNSGVQSTAPLESVTSYRHVFVPHPLEPRWQRTRETYKPSDQPMESLTTTRQHFQGLAGERRKSFKPANAGLQSAAPLENVTSYRHEFIPHPLEPCRQRTRETYTPSDQPMETLTTTRQHFQGLAGERRKSFKPANSGVQSTAPLESITSYRHVFVPHPVEPPWQRTRETYKPSDQPMESLTTTRQHFQGLAGERRKSFKPSNAGLQSAAPLESVTSYRHEFVPHPVEPCKQRTRETYKPSDQPMETLTTTRQHFQGLAGEMRQSCKPTNWRTSNGPRMEDSTIYRSEFTHKRIVCPASFELPPGYTFEKSDERGHKYFRKTSPEDNHRHLQQQPIDNVLVPVQSAELLTLT